MRCVRQVLAQQAEQLPVTLVECPNRGSAAPRGCARHVLRSYATGSWSRLACWRLPRPRRRHTAAAAARCPPPPLLSRAVVLQGELLHVPVAAVHNVTLCLLDFLAFRNVPEKKKHTSDCKQALPGGNGIADCTSASRRGPPERVPVLQATLAVQPLIAGMKETCQVNRFFASTAHRSVAHRLVHQLMHTHQF